MDRAALDLRRVGRAERRVDHAHAAVARVGERGGDVGGAPAAGGVQHAQRHDLRLRSDADDAGAVLGRGDRAGDVRAVAVGVLRVGVVVDEVVAGHEPAGEVRMAEVDAGVDDRDGHARAARGRPRLGRVDVGVGDAAVPPDGLAEVVQAPLERGERLGGEPARLVRLGPLDVRIGAQGGERGGAVADRR